MKAQLLSAPDSRRRIQEAAEDLFAQYGYTGVSVRDVAKRAAVNVALIGYYFGRKEDLLRAIFFERKSFIDERRRLIAAQAGAPPGARTVRRLMRAWAEPMLRLYASPRGEVFCRLIARSVWDGAPELHRIGQEMFAPLAKLMIGALARALPGRPRMSIIWAYEHALGALLMHLADPRIGWVSGGRARAGDLAYLDQLIEFLAAGFLALPARTKR